MEKVQVGYVKGALVSQILPILSKFVYIGIICYYAPYVKRPNKLECMHFSFKHVFN